MQPTLFVSHGAPTFAVAPGIIGPKLQALGASLPRPQAVLVVSPHWMPGRLRITAGERPETIHDFGGFPPALYELQYPAPGDPALALQIADRLVQQGIPAEPDSRRGLDHGAWVPLRHLFPAADVPVLQLALPRSADPRVHLALGRALSTLRADDILVIGSGSLTHNLYEFTGPRDDVDPYVTAFSGWIRDQLLAGDLDTLLDYAQRAPQAARAHPTNEHLMPLFIAIGAAGDGWKKLRHIDGGVDFGILSMDACLFAATD